MPNSTITRARTDALAQLAEHIRGLFGRAIEEDGRLCDAADAVDDLCDKVVQQVMATFPGLTPDALAHLAETPPSGNEERKRWLEEPEQHGFPAVNCNEDRDRQTWLASENAMLTLRYALTAILTFMCELRKQEQKDVLGASADRLRVVLDVIKPYEKANNYEYRTDSEYRITELERSMLEDFATGLLGKVKTSPARSGDTFVSTLLDTDSDGLRSTPVMRCAADEARTAYLRDVDANDQIGALTAAIEAALAAEGAQ